MSGLSCSSGSLAGTGTDTCTVTLSGDAGKRGETVTLSSSNTALAVPESVSVPSGSNSAAFTATASAVSSTETVTLTASAGGASATYSVQLDSSGTPALKVGSSSIAFGNVNEGTTATQSVTLTSSGTAALTIKAATVSGTGFTGSGLSYPLTLNPKQSATLDVQFDPAKAGAATGSVTISSNAATVTIALSGTGATAAYAVDLTWDAPSSSPDPVAGYNIYRAAAGGSYKLLNATVNPPTSFSDTTVASGATYTYEVMSVDAEGNESAPSNVYTASVP